MRLNEIYQRSLNIKTKRLACVKLGMVKEMVNPRMYKSSLVLASASSCKACQLGHDKEVYLTQHRNAGEDRQLQFSVDGSVISNTHAQEDGNRPVP